MKALTKKTAGALSRLRSTLKADIIISVLFTWVMPYILIMAAGAYIINDTQRCRMMDYLVTGMQSAQRVSCERLNDAMEDSLGASFASDLRAHYEDAIKQGKGLGELDQGVLSFLSTRYKNDEKFNFTVLYYIDDPETLYYIYGHRITSTYRSITEFRERVYPETLARYPKLGSSFDFFSLDGRIYMMRCLYLAGEVPYAVLCMELNQNNIFSPMDTWVHQSGSHISFCDARRTTGSSDISPFLPEYTEPGGECFRSGKNYYVYSWQKLSDGTPVGAAVKLKESAIKGSTEVTVIFALIGLLMLIPMILLIVRLIEKKIGKPIGRLVRAAEKIENGEWGYTITKEPGSQEFTVLTDAFNHMSVQLSAQVEKMYAEELALRDARIMALQSQINPHFLNNTLEIINWEARLGETAKVSRMLEALGTMLEAALDRKRRPLVHLSEELAYVEAYLYIISERFGKRLEVERDIDASLLDLNVPRLIIQPIIENAVEHGVAPRNHGKIKIDIHSDGKFLVITVFNDGEMSDEDIWRVKELLYGGGTVTGEKSLNLGIKNVNERIKIICGEECGLEIIPTDDGQTASIITLYKNLEM